MSTRKSHRPATTPQGRENQLISLASDLAEKQLREGSATSQVMTHYLKLGSSRERLEQEKLHQENLLLSVKIEAVASGQRIESMYEEALKAMKAYSGQDTEDYNEYDDY